MDIKELFDKSENGTLTFDQFTAMAKESGAKFTDLATGNYVSKSKYESDLRAKDTATANQVEGLTAQITALNETITSRDTDLADLQAKLTEAGQDATKLADLTNQFSSLQSKYDADMQAYQNKMHQQSYEFAVREFANTKKFTSQAAKRDFTQAMIAKNLQMDGDRLIGGDDFVSIYAVDNADAFVVDKSNQELTPEPQPALTPVPTITASTPGPANAGGSDDEFHFNFTGVR